MIHFYTAFPGRFFCFFSLLCISSCSKFDKEEPIPSYISVSSIDLVIPDTLKQKQGTASAKIADAWIFINDELQGIYELPAKFPVLKEGEVTLKIKPGIKQNGIGSTRPIYPFYDEYITTVKLEKEKIIEAKPKVYYRSYTNFVWMENFEGGGVSLIKTDGSDTTYKITTDPNLVFEGQRSLAGYLDNTHNAFECKTTNVFKLTTSGASVFLEMNYKTNSPMAVGFVANSNTSVITQTLITLNPTIDENGVLFWNKIYINLSDFLVDFYQYNDFNIAFRVERPIDLNFSEFYIDNIKLVQ